MKLARLAFTLTLVSFLAANFPLGAVGEYSRFLTTAGLIVVCVATMARLRVQKISLVLVSIYLFLTYSFVTILWTENREFSLAKWLLYGALVLTLLPVGVTLGQQTADNRNPFDPLKWGFLPLLISSCVALVQGYGWVGNNFRAYSGNSNALGASLMLTAPWLIYELKFLNQGSQKRKYFLLGLTGALVIVMLECRSRAAISGLLVMAMVAYRRSNVGHKMMLVYAIVTVIVITYAISGSRFFDTVYQTFIEKRGTEIYSSREYQMIDSWEAAKQGGIFGAGFGVSIGMTRYWQAGNTFSTASREKGNSFFAIVEETGIIGMLFYSVTLITLFDLLRKACRTANREKSVIALIAMGYFLGALLHGQFEAWFLSFGPDVSVYWGTLGLAIGALDRVPEKVPVPVTARTVLTDVRV